MPTITISLPTYVTELEAQPFERTPGVSGQVAQTVTLTAGSGSIVVAATASTWCWRFTEHGVGKTHTRFCAVTGDSTYAALTTLDPGTFLTAATPSSAAWEAIANSAAASAAAASAAAANVTPTIAGGALGIVTHIGAKTRAAVIATLNAAEALGRGIIVFFPAGTYDLLQGLSLSGYTCQIRGAGANMADATTPAGTVFYASTQTGPVLDFTGWVAPTNFSGRVVHEGFFVRGSGVADATKVNTGLQVDFCQSTTFRDIAIMGTGGAGLRLTAATPGFAVYLCDFERITIRTPVGASANDVPYLHATEANGNRLYGIGFISRSSTQDTGVSGAVKWEGSSSYATSSNKLIAWWFENLHVPTNGCLFYHSGLKDIIEDFEWFDIARETGATNCYFMKFAPITSGTDTGGNQIRGLIPGDNGGSVYPNFGILLTQSYNRIVGVKGYRGNNVVLASGVDYTYAELAGSEAVANTAAFVDNSGQVHNNLIDWQMNSGTTRAASYLYLVYGNMSADQAVDANYQLCARNAFQITLAANINITSVNNPTTGTRYTFFIKQDATGSRTLGWPANFKWAGSTAPTLTTTAGRTDVFSFYYDGTNFRETSRALNQN